MELKILRQKSETPVKMTVVDISGRTEFNRSTSDSINIDGQGSVF